SWSAKINKWGSQKGCSGTALYSHMEGNKPDFFGADAFVAKSPGLKWKLEHVNRKRFPVQAHHLIPKNHLPEHPVCTFLAKGYKQHEEYQLIADTDYNTDHTNNGYCLPYATPLAEWKGASDAKKKDLCSKVMIKTGRQLHQGSHRAEPYEVVADDEEAG